MQWRILDSGASDPALSGARNMAIDEAILSEIEARRSPPTIRVYGWSPACISLGHSQRAADELDLVRVRALGYDVVVRPTGGRAVLHIDELTYSLIAPPDAEEWCATQALSYRTISQAVAQALAQDGFGVALDRGYPVERPQSLRAMTPCFSSTARSEVVFGDRKVVGSAQRRLRDAYLQHGSILVSRSHRKMVDCLNLDAEKRARYLEILDRNAVCLEEALGRPVHWADLAEGFAERIARELGVQAKVGGLTEMEERKTDKLTEEKLRHSKDLIGITSGVGNRESGAKS
jgi:lipoate-protein ligase A